MSKMHIDDVSKQPSVANYFPSAKKPYTEAADIPQEVAIPVPILATVPPHQVDIPEIPILQQQDINELPNPLLKTESNHSFQKSWSCNYNWLKLAEDGKSLYCLSCNWAYEHKRWTPSDITTANNSTFPWENKCSGFVAFKSGLDAIKCHYKSGLHFRAQFAFDCAKNIHNNAIAIHMDAEQEFKIKRACLKSIFESIRFCGHHGIPMCGYRDENATANFDCLVALIGSLILMWKNIWVLSKFISPQMQNEALRDIAHTLMRGLLDR